MTIIERIIQYIDYKGITRYKFHKDLGFSNGFLDKSRDIGTDKYAKIIEYFPEINPEWLLLGKGAMIRIEENSAGISEGEVVNYLIVNFESLLKNSSFKIWYDNLYAKAKLEALKESLGMTVIGNSDSPEKKQKDGNR